MQTEYDSLMENKTWELIDRPQNKKILSNKWIFKLKKNQDGTVQKYKARLVARGYEQKSGVDFNEVFAPVARYETIRTLLAVAVQKKMHVRHMDVVTAYVQGVLNDEVYMEQPECFEINIEMDIIKLIELVKDQQILYDKDHRFYKNNEIKQEIWKKIGEKLNTDATTCKRRWNNLRDAYRKSLKSSKRKEEYRYSKDLGFLKRHFKVDNADAPVNDTRTPLKPIENFDKKTRGRKKRGVTQRGTINRSIIFSNCNNQNKQLKGFVNSDWAGDVDDRHSCSGYVFMLANGPITWSSKKQKSVAMSTMEAEYMALSEITREAVYMRRLLYHIRCTDLIEGPTTIYCDNQSAIKLSKNSVFHGRSKHIAIRYHFTRGACENNEVKIEYLKSELMKANILTKALAKTKHEKCVNLLNLN